MKDPIQQAINVIEQWQNEIDLMEGKPENEYPTSFCKHRITENKAILDALEEGKD